ncbi:hypothetical protein Tco_1360621 [Tanacetum coccineum]
MADEQQEDQQEEQIMLDALLVPIDDQLRFDSATIGLLWRKPSLMSSIKFICSQKPEVCKQGAKDLVFGMPIPMLMLNDDIKAFDAYMEYLTKAKEGKRAKGHGKGLVTKKGVELAIEKIATVGVPNKKRTEIVIKQTGKSEDVEDNVDSEETKEDEEPQLTRRRQTGVVIRSGIQHETDEEALDHSKKLKGVERMSKTAEFLLQLNQEKKASKQDFILQQRPKGSGEGSCVTLEVPNGLSHKSLNKGSSVTIAVLDEPSGSSISSSSESKIEDITSDDESDGADDKEKADDSMTTGDEKATKEQADEEQAGNEQHVDDQGGNEQAGNIQAKVHISEPQIEKPGVTILSSSQTLSSAEYDNQFINDNLDVLINDVLKEPVKPEVQSLMDKQLTSPLKLKNVLPKDASDFGKIKRDKASKQSMPKYSTPSFDEDSLLKYDQKDKLLKMMMKSKSYDKHPAHRALRRDDNDQDPLVDSKKVKKKRKQKDSESSKKDKDQAGSSKKGKSPSKSSKTNKSVHAKETVHDVKMEAGESVKEDVVDAKDPSQADAKWHKEPTVDDAPEQIWFNEMVNAEKDPLTFDDVMGSVIDFTKFTKNCLKKDKITKADLEGRAFKLLKGKHRNYIELEYNFEQCYLALTDQLDWVNPKGDRIPHDLSKPLTLHGAPVIGDPNVNYSTERDKLFNPVTKYRMKILSIIRILVDKQFGYGYLKEIVVRRSNQKEYTFKEADFPRLHLNDIEDIIVIQKWVEDVQLRVESYQTKLNITMPQFLMRVDEVYKFGYGTLKKVRDKLDYMLHNFELGYNDGMPKRAWTDKDKKRTASMLEKIEKTLLTRWIMRSLECFVDGRRIKTDYSLLMRTE